MEIKQFYDEALAQASYAILSEKEMALVDPARDPGPYFNFAAQKQASIIAVIETHPHADFVSSHHEISLKTGARVYSSRLTGADYPHTPFDSGDNIKIGKVKLRALNTPGHSPDSISMVVTDEQGRDHAVFTGDTLFIGDVGRPDLRENTGNLRARREELARDMYRSTRNILMKLEKDVVIYPAHGAGSLCGKALSKELTSTIGRQLAENYALQEMTEDEFVKVLLADQPFIPKYFGFDVSLNKSGAGNLEEFLARVPRLSDPDRLEPGLAVVDTRPKKLFNEGHVPGAIHIIEDGKYETWLGSIINPWEYFYIIGENEISLDRVIRRSAKIGYEKFIKGAWLNPPSGTEKTSAIDILDFRSNPGKYTMVDVRNESETQINPVFNQAINIPLYELRDRAQDIPKDKPVVVYCAGGYRSAAASSIIRNSLKGVRVYDLGEQIREFRSGVISSLE